ncbi:transposable element Tcb2 transposase [Trichonephila clavipes]|uniref:Transposable element Tcb2 transposase n=1 Tax=Trichonephila clavipes TaxID=2585209 RepID=A0A8X6SVH9_TRICX|nr:transposable element Tcb2 transposase [Trichonephila clavipes]
MADFGGSSFLPSDIGHVNSEERVSPTEGAPQFVCMGISRCIMRPEELNFVLLGLENSVNGSETPKYERYSSPTTPSLSYWHHSFNSDCPKHRLHGVGLYARRPLVCVRLTSRHRSDRRERIFIWRDSGSRKSPAFVHESVRDKILRPIVVPYAAAIGDDFILMDDNSRPHRANLVEDSLFEEGIVRMEWPACSPDMNPIKHVWDALGRRVAGRQPPPQTLQELERALLKEGDRIPPTRD